MGNKIQEIHSKHLALFKEANILVKCHVINALCLLADDWLLLLLLKCSASGGEFSLAVSGNSL